MLAGGRLSPLCPASTYLFVPEVIEADFLNHLAEKFFYCPPGAQLQDRVALAVSNYRTLMGGEGRGFPLTVWPTVTHPATIEYKF